jgi:hypothetical protein
MASRGPSGAGGRGGPPGLTRMLVGAPIWCSATSRSIDLIGAGWPISATCAAGRASCSSRLSSMPSTAASSAGGLPHAHHAGLGRAAHGPAPTPARRRRRDGAPTPMAAAQFTSIDYTQTLNDYGKVSGYWAFRFARQPVGAGGYGAVDRSGGQESVAHWRTTGARDLTRGSVAQWQAGGIVAAKRGA